MGCDAEARRWKLEDSGCKKKPVCKAMNYKAQIGDAKLHFKLPAAPEGNETREEVCSEDFEGKMKFKCDAEAKRWKLQVGGCKKKPVCKAMKYEAEVGDAKLEFK